MSTLYLFCSYSLSAWKCLSAKQKKNPQQKIHNDWRNQQQLSTLKLRNIKKINIDSTWVRLRNQKTDQKQHSDKNPPNVKQELLVKLRRIHNQNIKKKNVKKVENSDKVRIFFKTKIKSFESSSWIITESCLISRPPSGWLIILKLLEKRVFVLEKRATRH